MLKRLMLAWDNAAYQRRVKRRNKIWEETSPSKRRVLLAKDAKRMILNKTIYPQCQVYHTDVRREELATTTSCYACAAGSLFLSMVGFKGIPCWCGYDIPSISNAIAWPVENMMLIESAFEGFMRAYPENCRRKIHGWREKHPHPTDRLLAILDNIIENNGTFVL